MSVLLPATVFPSEHRSISCLYTDEKFKGAHNYYVDQMLYFDQATGQAVFSKEPEAAIEIRFVKKKDDGTWQTGLMSEQLLLLLLDRHKKLNDEFPSAEYEELRGHLQGALDALERRVRERTQRGVMGQHKA